MRNLFLISFAAILLCGCGKTEKLPEWEYTTVQIGSSFYEDMEKINDMLPGRLDNPTSRLNELGKDGWELVGMYTEVKTTYPNFGNEEYHTGIKTNTKTKSVTFVLKRLKQEAKGHNSDADNESVVVEEVVDIDTTACYADTTSHGY